MSVRNIVAGGGSLEETRQILRESPLGAIRGILTDKKILAACRRCGYQWRERLYGPITTVLHFVNKALQREESFAASWQEFWAPVAAGVGINIGRINNSAMTHARGRMDPDVLRFLAQEACGDSSEFAAPLWRGLRLKALDCASVSMPRNKELFGHFGVHRARKTTCLYPLATCAFLLEVGSSLVLDYRFGPFDPGEKRATNPLLKQLMSGDLLLADRKYSGTPALHEIRSTGAHFLMRKNATLKVARLPVIQGLGRNDFITKITPSKTTRKNNPQLPREIRVRIFKANWTSPDGRKVSEWFVTSLENAKRFNPCTLARLYHLRWRSETSYLEFKQTFHADVLRSKNVKNIEKEFHAHLLAYQLLRLLMAQAAREHKKKPTELSALNSVRWVLKFSNIMSSAPPAKLPALYKQLLKTIASSNIDIRPGRLEPRGLTREHKHYPRFRESRSAWRILQLKGMP